MLPMPNATHMHGLRTVQDMVVTRQAFEATLEITNSADQLVTGVIATLFFTDSKSNDRTRDFAVQEPSYSMPVAPGTQESLGPGQRLVIKWLIAPRRTAANATDVVYSVGGNLTYALGGVPDTMALTPADITVHPEPALGIHYFMETLVVVSLIGRIGKHGVPRKAGLGLLYFLKLKASLMDPPAV